MDGVAGAVEARAGRARSYGGLHGVIEGDEGFLGCGLEGGDYGRAGEEVGVCKVGPCCYGEGTASILGLNGVCNMSESLVMYSRLICRERAQ